MHPHKAFRWLLVLCFATASSLFLNAQGTGGRILGRVSDPTGAVLAGVQINLVNDQTGVSQTTQTDKTGYYEFPAVPVGNYHLEYQQQGFKKAVKKGLVVQVNQVITMNMTMQVGGAQEVVEVTSEAPLVDTTSTQLGAVVNDRSMTQLPLNSRDTYQFLQLQPGVQSQLGNPLIYGSDQAGAVSVNGGRGRANNFSVNGGDANDAFVNLPTVQPSPDSIQEFRVLTNTFDAEYGRNSGSVVNVVTKSGTNKLHGDVYEFFRNKVLNARNYFESTRPNFQQNQFGATLGGPIKKDRTFFFVSYEGRRVRKPTTFPVVSVPTLAERQGDFSEGGSAAAFPGSLSNPTILSNRPGCAAALPPGSLAGAGPIPYASLFPGNKIPFACMDPAALDLMQLMPSPNRADGTWQGTVIGPTRGDQATLRFDHRINDKQNFSAYYYIDDSATLQPFADFEFAGANVPGFGSNVAERFQQYNFTHTWTINSTTVNEAHFTYMREGQGTFQHPQSTTSVINSCPPSLPGQPPVTNGPNGNCFNDPASPRLGITPNLGPTREGVPFIQISGGAVIGNNSEGELPQVGNSFQWTDSITKVKGTHTLKFGADLRRQRFDQTLYFNVSGEYFYFGGGPNDTKFANNFYPNYLLGLPDEYGQGSAQTENVRSTNFSAFAQDSWKLTPSLTLNYGLRWELNTPIADISGHVQTFRPGQADTKFPCQLVPNNPTSEFVISSFGSTDCSPTGPANAVFPLGLVVPGDKGVPPGMTQTYYKAFAPRIGLAWSPGGSGKTSVRAGWGMFYNPIEQLVLEQFSAEPPFGGSTFLFNTLFSTPFLGQDGVTVNPNPFNGILSPKPGNNVDWSVFRPILLFGEFQPKMRTQYSDQYNLTVQREFGRDWVFQIGYVGSQGHRLLAAHDLNFGNPNTCLDIINIVNQSPNNPNVVTSFGSPGTCGQFLEDNQFTVNVPQGFKFHMPNGTIVTGAPGGTTLNFVGIRPNSSPFCNPLTGGGCPPDGVPVFTNIFAQDTIANSAYNSLQTMVEKRFSHGLQLQGSYTWSKSLDQASSFENIIDPLNPKQSRSLSLFDARHRFVLSYDWMIPIPQHQGALGKVIDGWGLSGITTFQSGFPIRVLSGADNELQSSAFFEPVGEPDQLKRFSAGNAHNPGCALGTGPTSLEGQPCQQVSNLYFDPNIFTENTGVDPSLLGRIGTAKRTICCGPGLNNWDIAVHKNIQVTEGTHVEFRGELFNAMNHTMFLNPDGNTTDGPQFGQVRQARDPRLVQFALKYIF